MLCNIGLYPGHFEYYLLNLWPLLKFSGESYNQIGFSNQSDWIHVENSVSLYMDGEKPLLLCLGLPAHEPFRS